MSSAAQISANRANAVHSTGPTSAEGLENSKYNATKHGLSGKQIVVKGEDPAAYDSLRSSLTGELQPVGEREAMLLEEISQNWWRLERARRAECQMLDKLGDLAAAMSDRAFLNLQRYMSRIERCYTRARKDLERLQVLRRRDEDEALKSAVRQSFVARLSAGQPSPIGSVSSTATAQDYSRAEAA